MANSTGTAMAVVTAEFREGTFSTQDREVQIEISNTQIQWKAFDDCKQNIYLYKTLCIVYVVRFIKTRKQYRE